MDKKYFVSWEMAATVALLGFNEDCVTEWNRDAKKRKLVNQGTYVKCNFWSWELDRFDRNPRKYLRELQKSRPDLTLSKLWTGRNVAAPTYEQLMDWFMEKYDIDFIERPHVGRTKQYICDPTGPGLGHCKLQACDTKLAAREQALWFVIEKCKPLPELIPEKENEQV